MKRSILKFISFMLAAVIICVVCMVNTSAEEKYPDLQLDCKSAVLMEASTGKILYASNENEALPPASVTKVMTLLLVMEAIEQNKISLTDMVSASEHACSMGGSQIFLESGEQMSVEDLLKSVVIASANDAAVTLAEYIAGTEEAFVQMMNEKAAELGMKNTNFENTNGLDDTTENHVTSALDIAIMSRELIKHEKIIEYSSIWMDSIRGGEFGLTNTNRLVRFYKGATGLKTGSTSKAGFCITATAKRDGMSLIAVIMASPTRDARNNAAVALLNYGFSNYMLYCDDAPIDTSIPVIKGKQNLCGLEREAFSAVIAKKDAGKIQKDIQLESELYAPLEKGKKVGKITYTLNGTEMGSVDILTSESVDELGFFDIFLKLLSKLTLKT